MYRWVGALLALSACGGAAETPHQAAAPDLPLSEHAPGDPILPPPPPPGPDPVVPVPAEVHRPSKEVSLVCDVVYRRIKERGGDELAVVVGKAAVARMEEPMIMSFCREIEGLDDARMWAAITERLGVSPPPSP